MKTIRRLMATSIATVLLSLFAIFFIYDQGHAQSPIVALNTPVIPLRPIASLSTVPVPSVRGLQGFVTDETAAIALGKALFWDMQAGSDGVQACGTCHFNSGADSRAVNALSPGIKAGDTTFQKGVLYGGTYYPNYRLHAGTASAGYGGFHDGDFPFHKVSDPDNADTATSDVNDVVSSEGVFSSNFDQIVLGSGVDQVTITSDNIFFYPNPKDPSKTINVRRAEPRNTPTVINALFNYRNFWDGRAQNTCNGANPFGERDQNSHFYSASAIADFPVQTFVRIPNSALCSQALGPPMSNFEMSSSNRNFKALGKKLLSVNPLQNFGKTTPLGMQVVATDDSVLGVHSNATTPGLKHGYADMIKAAFAPEWWQSQMHVCMDSTGNETVIDPTKNQQCAAAATDYSQMEYNFSLFWGIAIQEYETTLRADQTPLDVYFQQQKVITLIADGQNNVFAANLVSSTVSGPVDTYTVTVQTLDPIFDASDQVIGFDDGAGHIAGPGVVSGTINYKTGALSTFFADPPRPGVRVQISYSTGPTPLSQQDLRGLHLFQNKARCNACHGGPELTNAANATVSMSPLERMIMGDGNIRVYDEGFYNSGVRPTAEDPAVGDVDGVVAKPLSMAEMARLQTCADPSQAPMVPGRPGEGIDAGPMSCNDSIARMGNMKTPGLRNLTLTAPYFHNGGQLTLEQVVEFYNRGGDFAVNNVQQIDPDIQPLGLTQQEKDDLVAFLRDALTDPRVLNQSAPFDHPEIYVPNGHPVDSSGFPVEDPINPGQAMDLFMVIPPTGKTGGKPLPTFLQNLAP